MAGMSKSQLLAWLREKPQTMNWGAILAFNRTDTNTVLLQDYINRFSTAAYLDPVQGYVKDANTLGQYITDYVLDYPRLSFEIASVEDAIPSARLTLKVIGGTQVTLGDIPGGTEVTRIDVVDPLNGPELTLNLQLVDVPATVNSAGQVVLDLKNSSNFSLSYSDFERERTLGGAFFETLFTSLPDAKRVLVISEIARDPNNPIKPQSIKIRTQAAPGAKLRSADNYGDGAVLVFVGMEGEVNGGDPDPDFPYLIPDDAETEYGATILLSNKVILDKVIGQALNNVMDVTDYELTGGATGFLTLNATAGQLERPSWTFLFQGRPTFVEAPWLWPGSHMSLSLKVAEGGIRSDQANINDADNTFVWVKYVPGEHHDHYGYLLTDWSVNAICHYSINPDSQLVEATYPITATIAPFSSSFVSSPPSDKLAVDAWGFYLTEFNTRFTDALRETTESVFRDIPPINVFVLKNLLFKGGNVVVLDDVALPGDMVIFGRIGPSLTKFAVNPIQPLIGAGEQLQFTTEPAVSFGLTWTVEHILGGTGDKGTITNSGLYTAPNAVSGAFLRVKVTARGEGGYSSSALVSVVINDITVSPVIQTCEAGHTRTLSAGTKGTGALTWTLKNPGNGGRLVAGQNGQYVYTAPPLAGEGDAAFVVDEVVVKNELTDNTKSAYVMAVLADMTLSVQKDSTVTLPANQVKLKVKSGTSVIPDASLTWETLAGSGMVADGIYTQPGLLDQRFSLLVASYAPAPDIMPDLVFQGYILLPLPLFDAPETLVPGLKFNPV